MALEAIIDVAEMDDLGVRVVAVEPRGHVAREALRPSRIFGIWGAALVTIVVFGLVGRLLEPRRNGELQPESPLIAATVAADDAAVLQWPSNGHSSFRYPANGKTTMTLRFDRVPSLHGSIARLDVGGRIEGPVGNVAVQPVSGDTLFGEVTRYYAPIGGRPPAPFGAFDLSFAVPDGVELSDLWIVARAYLRGDVVAVASEPVHPTWSQGGPDKYVIDDIVGPLSPPRDGSPDGDPAAAGGSSRGVPSASS